MANDQTWLYKIQLAELRYDSGSALYNYWDKHGDAKCIDLNWAYEDCTPYEALEWAKNNDAVRLLKKKWNAPDWELIWDAQIEGLGGLQVNTSVIIPNEFVRDEYDLVLNISNRKARVNELEGELDLVREDVAFLEARLERHNNAFLESIKPVEEENDLLTEYFKVDEQNMETLNNTQETNWYVGPNGASSVEAIPAGDPIPTIDENPPKVIYAESYPINDKMVGEYNPSVERSRTSISISLRVENDNLPESLKEIAELEELIRSKGYFKVDSFTFNRW